MRRLLAAALLLAAGINALGYTHARAMLVFAEGGARTPAPESLGPLQKLGVLLGGVRVPRPAPTRDPSSVGLAYTTAWAEAADGAPVEVWLAPCAGCRGVAVLAHGYSAAADQLLEAAALLGEMGWASALVNQRGSGGTPGHQTTLGWTEGQDVAAALALARSRFPGQPAALYGFSMGGASALRAIAGHGARPDALIVEATFADLRRTVGNRFALMGLPRSPGAELLVFWGGLISGFDGFAFRPAEDARAVACPALVLGGAADTRAPPEDARAIAAAIPGARLALVDGAGHAPLAWSHPAAWAAAVGALLEGS